MFLFLGAGASRVFGIPTTLEFIDLFQREIGENNLFKTIKNNFGPDFFDLEVLMTILDDLTRGEEFFQRVSPQTSKFLFKISRKKAIHYITNKKAKTNAKELFSRLKRIIREECMKAVEQKEAQILEVYDKLFGSFGGTLGTERIESGDGKITYPTDLRIFTTNYDTCLEVYLNRRQIEFTKGIVSKYGENILDVDSYDDGRTKVGVFKLHGSIDLFKKNGIVRQFPAFTEGPTYLGERYGEELMRWPLEFSGYQNIIESPYLDFFRLFRDRIKKDRTWIIIGSSFRDRTICSIMNDVLNLKRKRERARIVCINPKPEIIKNRLKSWSFNTLADLMQEVRDEFGNDTYLSKMVEKLKLNAR